MKLHILNSVGQSALRTVIEQVITASGNEIGDLATSTHAIGLVEDSDWHKFEPNKRIILKNPDEVDTVPSEALLVNVFSLVLINQPSYSLVDWLRTEPAVAKVK